MQRVLIRQTLEGTSESPIVLSGVVTGCSFKGLIVITGDTQFFGCRFSDVQIIGPYTLSLIQCVTMSPDVIVSTFTRSLVQTGEQFAIRKYQEPEAPGIIIVRMVRDAPLFWDVPRNEMYWQGFHLPVHIFADNEAWDRTSVIIQGLFGAYRTRIAAFMKAYADVLAD